jgi:DNA-binding transcriptional ArsR family regulator
VPIRLAGIGQALSHPTRIGIIVALREEGTELSSSDLAQCLATKLGAIDYHVKVLLSLGIVESQRTHQGRGSRQHFFALTPDARSVLAAVAEYQPSKSATSG